MGLDKITQGHCGVRKAQVIGESLRNNNSMKKAESDQKDRKKKKRLKGNMSWTGADERASVGSGQRGLVLLRIYLR